MRRRAVSKIFEAKAAIPASLGCRDDLARVAEACRIEHIAHRHHLFNIRVVEDQAHVSDLVHSDSVLAGDRTTHSDTKLHDLSRSSFNAPDLIGVPPVKTH